MTSIDERIGSALSEDDREFLASLDEGRGMFTQIGDVLTGPLGGWSKLIFAVAFVLGFVLIYAGYRFFTASAARDLGIPEEKWVHIHAVSVATELELMQRPDLGSSPASIASLEEAIERSGKRMSDMRYLDFYSCFAIPVFNAIDHFEIPSDDPRGLTLTGGLPFFGGAGNNYSAHAICEAVRRVRDDPGSYALVGANGGWMSKYSTGIYSTDPADWSNGDRFEKLPMASDALPRGEGAFASATVETYTINHGKKGSATIFIGRNTAGERVCGNADMTDDATRVLFESGEPFGAELTVTQDERGRNIGRVAA